MKRALSLGAGLALLLLAGLPVFAQPAAPAAAKPEAVKAAQAAPEDQYFDSNGVKIHYIVVGKGEPVLLIHGYTVNIQQQWGAPGIIKALSENYRVIALDNRGHGKSDKPHEADKYGAEMVEDAVRLLDHLKIRKAHVVGYSMGGFITGKLVATHPDRVRTATMGGAGWNPPGESTTLDFLDKLADSLDAGKGIGPLIERLTPEGKPKPSPEQLETYTKMITANNDTKALAACARGMKKLNVSEDQLKANKVPVLALIGSVDPLKAGVDLMQPKLANLKVVVIDGADHMTAPGRPEFISNLKTFLAENARPAGKGAGKGAGKAKAKGGKAEIPGGGGQ